MISLSWLDHAVLFAYLAVVISVGAYYANKMKDFDAWAMAGRQVPWLILLGTTSATMIGGGASVGSVAGGYTVGLGIAVVTTGWHLQTIFAGLWVAPKLRALPFYTVADFIGYRYGELPRRLVGTLSLAFCVGGLGAQIVAMGRIVEIVLGISFLSAVLLGTAIIALYSLLGGYWAVIQTDMLQFVILVVGFATAALLGLHAVGGYEGLTRQVPASHFDLFGTWSPLQLLGIWLAMLLGETFAPSYVQRYYAAVNARQARWGTVGAGVFMLLFLPVTVVTLGLVARVRFPDLETADLAWPLLVTNLFPTGLSGLMIAAALAALMSTADSMLGSGATVVARDFYQRIVQPDATQRRLVLVARLATVVLAAFAVVAALLVPNVLDLLLYSYSFWAPSIILPILVGVLWYRKKHVLPVFASMVIGLFAALVWLSLGEPYQLEGSVVGVFAALLTFLICRPLLRNVALLGPFEPLGIDLAKSEEV